MKVAQEGKKHKYAGKPKKPQNPKCEWDKESLYVHRAPRKPRELLQKTSG